MTFSFGWHRKTVSPREYAENMEIPEPAAKQEQFTISVEGSDRRFAVSVGTDFLDALHGSKHLTAYTVAADIRKFEIDKYWQRTLYFWGFITAIYVAYFNVLKEFYTDTSGARGHGALPLVILSALGLFFCFSWLLASKGSKHWQENWENHLDLLEDGVTGPLYKTYRAGSSYSVSAINIMAGRVMSACAYGLLAYECVCFVDAVLGLEGSAAIAVSLVLMVVIGVSLRVYSCLVTGNGKCSGKVTFDFKQYGEGA